MADLSRVQPKKLVVGMVIGLVLAGCTSTSSKSAETITPRNGADEALDRPASSSVPVHLLDLNKPYRQSDYEFVEAYIGSRSIVQLGESIHVTAEFPKVRLNFVRFLHERMGFDLLALEGSPVDAWLAQDLIYNSEGNARETSEVAQDAAWFALWNTEPMRELMEYVVTSQSSESPLYLTSFDVQPGMTRSYSGDGGAAVAALIAAVGKYAEQPMANPDWIKSIRPFLGCYRSRQPRSLLQKRDAERAIDELEHWIDKMTEVVQEKTSAHHATALTLIGPALRQSIELCEAVTQSHDGATHVYQETRDRLNAKNVTILREKLSSSKKLIVWAHHSHIHHNSMGKATPSMGQHLLESEGDEALYTIGLFAGRGTAMSVNDDDCPAIQAQQIKPAEEFAAEKLLQDTAKSDFFVDFTRLQGNNEQLKPWLQPSTTRLEIGWAMPTVLAKDFHAAVFIQEVHQVELLFLPALLRKAMALKCVTDPK